MDHQPTISREAELAKMLSTLRTETTYPDDFEDRFLSEFHKRSSSEIVRQSSFSLFKEHIHAYFQNFGGWKWAYGAMGACTALIACTIALSSGSGSNGGVFGNNDKAARTPVSDEKQVLIIENIPANQRNTQNTDQKEKVVPITRQLADF